MNCCFIEYPDGICTHYSASAALVTQSLSIIPFVNQSLTSQSYGASSTSLCTFVNTI